MSIRRRTRDWMAASRRRDPQLDPRVPAAFVRSLLDGRRRHGEFEDVETYVGFIGCPRTGSTMLCSLLSAHPDAVVANELDALRFVRLGFRRDQLYSLILRRDREFAEKGRRWGGLRYQDSYDVGDSWQGAVRHLKVIGDKRGPDTSWQLSAHPDLLTDLQRVVGVPVRLVHPVRDPYDTVATMHLQSGRPLDDRIDTHFRLCTTVAQLRSTRPDVEVLDVRSEDLIADPRATISALCEFLHLDADEPYLESCGAAIRAEPHRTRHDVSWTAAQLARVQRTIETFDFLHSHYPSGWEPPTGSSG